jgi:hypothetical protein
MHFECFGNATSGPFSRKDRIGTIALITAVSSVREFPA